MTFWQFDRLESSQASGCSRIQLLARGTLMARFSVTGTVLGLRSKPYSIKNEDGTTNSGTSHRLVIFDPEAVESMDLAVKQDQVGLFAGLGVGELVTLPVDVFANNNKLSMTAVPPVPKKS